MRGALQQITVVLQGPLFPAQEPQAIFNGLTAIKAPGSGCNRPRDRGRCQFAEIGEKVTAVLVKLAKNSRSFINRPVVQLPCQLVLNN